MGGFFVIFFFVVGFLLESWIVVFWLVYSLDFRFFVLMVEVELVSSFFRWLFCWVVIVFVFIKEYEINIIDNRYFGLFSLLIIMVNEGVIIYYWYFIFK